MTVETLSLELKVGAVDDAGTFEGVASVFGELDLMGDTVAPGAFRKSLATHKRAGRMPLMLWAHDLSAPIGVWADVRETVQGLAVKGHLILDTVRGREAYALLKARALDGLSIGFRVLKSVRTKTGRLLQEIDLAEISLVTLPALSSARVHSVKSSQRRRMPAYPLKDTEMIDIAAPDTPDETATADLPPEVTLRIDALEAKAATIDKLTAQLDQVQTRLARPSARVETKNDQQQLEQKAFLNWCRKGTEALDDLEKKILSTIAGSPSLGGWNLVPQTFLQELMRNLVEFTPMRQVARVQQVGGNPVLLPKRTHNLTAAWVAEEAQHSLSEPGYEQQSISIFEARVSVEVTNQLLEDSAFDLSAELSRDFAEEFARLENVAFQTGNGTSEPHGFRMSGDFTTVGDTISADSIIDLFYSVPSVYAARGTWLMPRTVMGDVRKLRSAVDGPYIWADSLVPGQPASLLGRPVVEAPDLTAAGSPSPATVAFGDWSRAYRIFDRIGLEVLRDPYTRARNSIVVFHARRRVAPASDLCLRRAVDHGRPHRAGVHGRRVLGPVQSPADVPPLPRREDDARDQSAEGAAPCALVGDQTSRLEG
jgi:HK97 family phage major capsid protein/HK97 family phage prohead protease